VRKLHNKVTGFTLIEMIITLVIGSLLLAWGVPSYRDFKMRKMVTDNANQIVFSLTQARAEAIRYGVNVVVSPNGTWQDGWTVVAEGIDGNPDIDIANQDLIEGVELTAAGGNKNIVFNRIGGLVGGVSEQFRVQVSGVANAERRVEVSPSGTVKAWRP